LVSTVTPQRRIAAGCGDVFPENHTTDNVASEVPGVAMAENDAASLGTGVPGDYCIAITIWRRT
jgi:hypothetical protein